MAGAPGVRVHGELDLSTAPELTDELDAAIRGSHGAFVVDLTAVDFLDSTGLTAFVRARALLGREERDLVIVCPPGRARRVFDISGVAELFALFESPEAAAAALQPAE